MAAISALPRDEYLAQLNAALHAEPLARAHWRYEWADPGSAAPASGILIEPADDPEAHEFMSALLVRFAVANGVAPLSEPVTAPGSAPPGGHTDP